MAGMFPVAAAPAGGTYGFVSALAMTISAAVTTSVARARTVYFNISSGVTAAVERVRDFPKELIYGVTAAAERTNASLKEFSASVTTGVEMMRSVTMELAYSLAVNGYALVETAYNRMIEALVYTSASSIKLVSVAYSAASSVAMAMNRVWQIPKTAYVTLTAASQRYRVYVFFATLAVSAELTSRLRHLLINIQAAYTYISSSAGWADRLIPMTFSAGVATDVTPYLYRRLRVDAVASVVTSAATTFYNTVQYMTRTATLGVSATVDLLQSLRLTISAGLTTSVEMGRSVFMALSAGVATSVVPMRDFTRFLTATVTTSVTYIRQFFWNAIVATATAVHDFRHHKGTPITTISSRRMTVEADSRSAAATSEDRRMAVYGEDRNMNV